jgi:hypothetical protein
VHHPVLQRKKSAMPEICPNYRSVATEQNDGCTDLKKHKTPRRRNPREKAQLRKVEADVPAQVMNILQYCVGASPYVLAQSVREVTGVNFQNIPYANTYAEREAGELFVCFTYFGLGLTHNEVADCAKHSGCWVQTRCNALREKFLQATFVAKLRDIVLYMEAQRS